MSNCPRCDSEWAYRGLNTLDCVNPQCFAFSKEHMLLMFRDFWKKRAVMALTEPDNTSAVKLPLGWHLDLSRHDTVVFWHLRTDDQHQVITVNF